jgi:hypothetical protein
MKTQHTQGKWKLNPDNPYQVLIDSSIKINLKAFRFQKHEDEYKSIMRLIAAAPDLLEALIEIRKHGLIEKDGYEIVVKTMNEAIKKAAK